MFNLQVPARAVKAQRQYMINLKFSKSRMNDRDIFPFYASDTQTLTEAKY